VNFELKYFLALIEKNILMSLAVCWLEKYSLSPLPKKKGAFKVVPAQMHTFFDSFAFSTFNYTNWLVLKQHC